MNRAVIMDRDGIINEDRSYLYKIEEFRFTDGIFQFCSAAQEKGYLLIVTTNQSGIARGYYTEDDLLILNDWMTAQFRAQGIDLARIYYCPFHPEKGIGKYKADSPDRKPNPGMLLRAMQDFDLDMSSSLTLGDKDSDMEAGRRAGIGKLVLMPSIYKYHPAKDVFVVKTLSEAVNFL